MFVIWGCVCFVSLIFLNRKFFPSFLFVLKVVSILVLADIVCVALNYSLVRIDIKPREFRFCHKKWSNEDAVITDLIHFLPYFADIASLMKASKHNFQHETKYFGINTSTRIATSACQIVFVVSSCKSE